MVWACIQCSACRASWAPVTGKLMKGARTPPSSTDVRPEYTALTGENGAAAVRTWSIVHCPGFVGVEMRRCRGMEGGVKCSLMMAAVVPVTCSSC